MKKILVIFKSRFYQFLLLAYNVFIFVEAFKECGLTLVGAFDILSGKLKNVNCRELSKYLCHWRFYYDPPEFQVYI